MLTNKHQLFLVSLLLNKTTYNNNKFYKSNSFYKNMKYLKDNRLVKNTNGTGVAEYSLTIKGSLLARLLASFNDSDITDKVREDYGLN